MSNRVAYEKLSAALRRGPWSSISLPLYLSDLKVLMNHGEPAFLERRREELDSYLRALVQLPRLGRSADVWVFLGLPGLPPTSDKMSTIT